jgi:hypothetical protein
MAASGRPREAAEMLEKALAAGQGAGDVSGVARALQVLVKRTALQVLAKRTALQVLVKGDVSGVAQKHTH